MGVGGVVGVVGFGAGCAGPGLGAGFDAPDPSARLHAAVQAGRENDRSKIPRIIELLESDDAGARWIAFGVLRAMTGEDRGYDPLASDASRRSAVEQWRRAYPALTPASSTPRADVPQGAAGPGRDTSPMASGGE